MKVRRAILGGLTGWYALLWLGGVATYLTMDQPPAQAAWAAPAFLVTAALLVLATAQPGEAVLLLGAGLVGWCAEVVGVRTGFPFGGYTYTDVLGPSRLGVPLTMVAAWMLLVAYGRFVGRALGLRGAGWVLTGAAWMVGMDAVIDPLAGGALAYWTWAGSGAYYGIPASNFLGWFAVSVLTLAVLTPVRRVSSHHGSVGLSLLLFFTVLAATRGMWLAVAAGAVLLAGHVAVVATAVRRSR